MSGAPITLALGANALRAGAGRSSDALHRYGLPLMFFWAVSLVINALVLRLHLPVPGNAIAIFVTLAVLVLHRSAAEYLDATALLLVRHLSLFFVPLAVGVVGSWTALARVVTPLAVTLVVSVAVGVAVTGLVAQRLLRGSS
jgi:holin-like protein